MFILAESQALAVYFVLAMFVGFWGYTAYDIVKSRAGWGYTLGILLVPFLAVLLWWVAGKWEKGDPKRAAIAHGHTRRIQSKQNPSHPQ